MAITCGVTQGRTIDCADVVGGLKAVYFAASFQDLPVVASVTSGVMSGLPDDAGGASSTYNVYRYELRPELSSMPINIQGDTITELFSMSRRLVCSSTNWHLAMQTRL